MKLISLHGLECVLEIMRVLESRKAERFEKAMDSSKADSPRLLGPPPGPNALLIALSMMALLNDEERRGL
jgi:hypothetical protein